MRQIQANLAENAELTELLDRHSGEDPRIRESRILGSDVVLEFSKSANFTGPDGDFQAPCGIVGLRLELVSHLV